MHKGAQFWLAKDPKSYYGHFYLFVQWNSMKLSAVKNPKTLTIIN